jgi:rSAM/selenodomain-associated transferase 2
VFQGNKKKWGWTRVATLLVSGGLLWFILRRLDVPKLLDAVQEANFFGLFAAFLVFGTGLLFASWRWHLMLRFGGNVVHPGATIRGAVIGHCFHTFLFGAAGGDVVKSGIYARWYGLKMSEVLAAAPLDRLMALVGAIFFGTLMMLLGALNGGFEKLAGRQLWLPVLWIAGVAVLVVLAIVGVYSWRGTRFAALDRFREALQKGGLELFKDRPTLLKSTIAAFCVHACLSFTMVISLASVTNVSISWVSVLWLFPVISLISGLPISIGGAGLREGSALVLLGLFSIPAEDAVAASLFTLVISFAWCFVGLSLWWLGEKGQASTPAGELPETISVVIPTLNEVEAIEGTIASVRQVPEVLEILIADGGSEDGTVALGESLGCRVIRSPLGRGTQMRAAAQEAQGEVVWLLHADTVVPLDSGRALINTFRDPDVVGGGFWKAFDQTSFWMLGSRFRCLVRLLLGGRLLGDQAMYVRRSVLEEVGGVPDLPLMEEFEICRLLRLKGRLALADATVITSARKFRGLGALRTYWLMGEVTIRYYMGTPVRELAEIYSKK